MSWSPLSMGSVQSWSWAAERACHWGYGLAGGSGVDGDTHGAGGPLDDLHGRVDVAGVEVDELALGDLADLVAGEPADLVLLRDARALGDAGGLLDELGGRRGLGDEREAAVLVDRDLHGDHLAALRLGGSVVRLAELHDVHTVGAERGTHRRSRSRRPGVQLHLDERGDLLLGRHF